MTCWGFSFMSIDLSCESAPDATTLMGFRHPLEGNDKTQVMLAGVNIMLLKRGILVDAALVAAPSSTKSRKPAQNIKTARSHLSQRDSQS